MSCLFAWLRIRITQMRYLVSCHFCRVADSLHLNAYADPHQRFFVTATTDFNADLFSIKYFERKRWLLSSQKIQAERGIHSKLISHSDPSRGTSTISAMLDKIVLCRLRHIPRNSFKVCVLGDQQHCDEAKEKGTN